MIDHTMQRNEAIKKNNQRKMHDNIGVEVDRGIYEIDKTPSSYIGYNPIAKK